MLEEGISYPAWGDRAIGRFVIGSALWFVWLLLVPVVLLYGYGMRAMRQTGRGDDVPPQWHDWTGLFVDGVRAIVVSFVYVLIPNLIGAVILGAVFFLFVGGGAAGGTGGDLLAGAGALTLLFGALVVIVVELLVIVLLPAALINTAVEESIAAGFDTAVIPALVVNSTYLLGLIHVLFIWAVTFVVASVASVTVVLFPAVLFWGGLSAARVLGSVYRRTLTATPVTTTPSSEAGQSAPGV